jgi:hypothetical protein
MNEPNALPLGKRLLAAGVPVVVVRQGDHFPNWGRITSADQCDLSLYRPGKDALALIGGHGIDLVDEDTKDGGSVDHLPPFKTYGVTRTPTGGRHFAVRSTGIGKVSPLATAFGHVGDYVGGTIDHGSRLLGFLPGSVRIKHDGVAYVEEVAWDIAGCLAADPDPDLVAALQDAGGSLEGKAGHAAASYADVDAFMADHSTLPECDYGAAAVTGLIAEFAAATPGDPVTGRHAAATRASVRAVELIRAGCLAADALDDLREAFLAVKPDADGEWWDCVRWAMSNAKGASDCRIHGRIKPEEEFTVISGPKPKKPTAALGGNSSLPLAVQLRHHVEAAYDVFPAADDSRIFVQSKDGGRANLLTGGLVIRAGQGAGLLMGNLSAAATEAAKVLAAQAEARTSRRLMLRAHSRPDRIVLDLAQPGNSGCVVATADGWAVQAVPPADVLFQSAGKPLPDPERGGDMDELRVLLRWEEGDPRWLLVKGWLPCSLLADSPRPLLTFLGPQGSAKSTTGRFVVDLIDPKPSGALGSGFGRNRSDDETKAFASYLVAWDNVSKVSAEGADFLSRLVTGDMIEKRRLYTNDEIATITYRRTGVLTGVSLPRGIKADTLDRLILVALDPLEERISERTLEAEWAEIRPRVLAGVLDLTVRLLAGKRDNPRQLRMADYAEALHAIDPALYDAYASNVREARAEMASNDPFIAALLAWLTREKGQTWEGTATDARRVAQYHQTDEGRWWPTNGKAFMDTVTANLELLYEVGVTVTERKVKGSRLKRFTLDG